MNNFFVGLEALPDTDVGEACVEGITGCDIGITTSENAFSLFLSSPHCQHAALLAVAAASFAQSHVCTPYMSRTVAGRVLDGVAAPPGPRVRDNR